MGVRLVVDKVDSRGLATTVRSFLLYAIMHSDLIFFHIGPYEKKFYGTSCRRIRTRRECEEAARQLGFPDTSADQMNSNNYPEYCFTRYDKLFFNSGSDINPNYECHPNEICFCRQ